MGLTMGVSSSNGRMQQQTTAAADWLLLFTAGIQLLCVIFDLGCLLSGNGCTLKAQESCLAGAGGPPPAYKVAHPTHTLMCDMRCGAIARAEHCWDSSGIPLCGAHVLPKPRYCWMCSQKPGLLASRAGLVVLPVVAWVVGLVPYQCSVGSFLCRMPYRDCRGCFD